MFVNGAVGVAYAIKGGDIADLVIDVDIAVGGGNAAGTGADQSMEMVIPKVLAVGSGGIDGSHSGDVAHLIVFVSEIGPGIGDASRPMLDGLETEVAVARAPASRIVLRMVEVGGVDAARGAPEKGHLPSTIVTHVTDEADATVAQAVFPFAVEGNSYHFCIAIRINHCAFFWPIKG